MYVSEVQSIISIPIRIAATQLVLSLYCAYINAIMPLVDKRETCIDMQILF